MGWLVGPGSQLGVFPRHREKNPTTNSHSWNEKAFAARLSIQEVSASLPFWSSCYCCDWYWQVRGGEGGAEDLLFQVVISIGPDRSTPATSWRLQPSLMPLMRLCSMHSTSLISQSGIFLRLGTNLGLLSGDREGNHTDCQLLSCLAACTHQP